MNQKWEGDLYKYIYIHGCLSTKGRKQEFPAIFTFTFTHRYTGSNKPRWQNVAFDLVIQLQQTHRKPLRCVFTLATLTLSEPHEIRRIENSVEEKMGIEKIGESDINFWLHSLHPLLLFVIFVINSFPISNRRTFELSSWIWLLRSFPTQSTSWKPHFRIFKSRVFNLVKKWNSASTMELLSF